MELIKDFFYKYRQLITYFLIGGGCASIDYLIFVSLSEFFNVNYLFANVVSVNAGIITSFILNRNFNFKVKDKVISRFLYFYLVGIFGLMVSSLLLVIMIDGFNYHRDLSKIISIIVIAFIQFFLNKLITFKVKND